MRLTDISKNELDMETLTSNFPPRQVADPGNYGSSSWNYSFDIRYMAKVAENKQNSAKCLLERDTMWCCYSFGEVIGPLSTNEGDSIQQASSTQHTQSTKPCVPTTIPVKAKANHKGKN
jgi:hypothetical protein